MNKSRTTYKVIFVVSILFSFSFGITTILAFPIDEISSIKLSILQKIGRTEQRVTFPAKIESSRYQFILEKKSTLDGVFKLANVNNDQFFALDRFSGKLFRFDRQNEEMSNLYLGNIYEQLGLPSNESESKVGQKINNAGKLNGEKSVFTTAFDLEYAFEKLYMTVTVPSIDNTCTALKLYVYSVPSTKLDKIWDPKVLLETPCILDKSTPTMWGGRITHSLKSIFVSVGEQRYDPSGFPKADQVSASEIKNSNSPFGKVIEISPQHDEYKIYSSGHRNAQGLFFSHDDGKLFESEHGPFGGDEVNILLRGKNYGWPFGTFGKPYPLFDSGNNNDEFRAINPSYTIDKQLSKFGAKSGQQANASLPILSWTPSVGAGNLTKVQSTSIYEDWQGNIVFSAMVEKSLHRLILSKNTVVFDERIPIGLRVRDFIINESGYLILSTDEGKLLFYKATSPQITKKY